MKKLAFLSVMAVFFLSACANMNKTSGVEHLLVPGVGFDQMKIGTTTKDDIIKTYGKDYKTDTYYTGEGKSKELYSTRISYPKTGAAFYFKKDENTIFTVHFTVPFNGKTKEGIVLNKSTFKDVVKAYGAKEWDFSGETMGLTYDGIRFMQSFKGKLPISDKDLLPYMDKKVTEISID